MKKLLDIISVIFTILILGAIIFASIGLLICLLVILCSSFVMFIKGVIAIIAFIITMILIGYLFGRGFILIDEWKIKRIKRKVKKDVRK